MEISSAGRVVPELDGERFLVDKAQGTLCLGSEWSAVRRYRSRLQRDISPARTDPQVTGSCTRCDGTRLHACLCPRTPEEDAAATLAAHTEDLSKVIFLNSQSEAVHLACRTARAVTGKRKIVKIAAGI